MMTLEAKKISIIEQVLALQEEGVLDRVISALEIDGEASNNLVQEEEAVYSKTEPLTSNLKLNFEQSDLSFYTGNIEPKLDIEKLKIEQNVQDTFSQGKLEEKPLRGLSRNMGKNDSWIAATTHISGAKLITTDKDFQHLDREYFEMIYIER